MVFGWSRIDSVNIKFGLHSGETYMPTSQLHTVKLSSSAKQPSSLAKMVDSKLLRSVSQSMCDDKTCTSYWSGLALLIVKAH